jgi:REP element-mobilizing transposase RayT
MKTDKFQNKYRIPSSRAVWHDYNGGDYFITICTAERMHYFGEINNGEMVLNGLGQKFDELILNIKNHNPYCEIPVYQIMPNHVHLIVCVDGACRDAACHVSTENAEINAKRDAACHVSTDGNGTNDERTVKNEKMRDIAVQCGLLSSTMGGLKSALTKYANLNKIKFGWQTRFHDLIIRSQEEMNMIATYIENNVATWENDKFYTK